MRVVQPLLLLAIQETNQIAYQRRHSSPDQGEYPRQPSVTCRRGRL